LTQDFGGLSEWRPFGLAYPFTKTEITGVLKELSGVKKNFA